MIQLLRFEGEHETLPKSHGGTFQLPQTRPVLRVFHSLGGDYDVLSWRAKSAKGRSPRAKRTRSAARVLASGATQCASSAIDG